jgi:predicted DNA-binding transcriptional regulator AlpA
MSNHRTRINVRQLEDRLAVSKQTIWRWYSSGDFPRPHYLGQNRLWWLREVEAWEEQHQRTQPSMSVNHRGHAA